MPFKPSDARKHNKNIAEGSMTKWSAIANSVLQQTGDEGKAIRIANSAVKSKNTPTRRR